MLSKALMTSKKRLMLADFFAFLLSAKHRRFSCRAATGEYRNRRLRPCE